MKAYLEITEWDTDFAVPNHVYFLNDSKDKMYGYAPGGGKRVQPVKTPYRFHTRGRKFREVANTWNFQVDETKFQPAARTWTVAGSKGNQYTVSEQLGTWSCTCTGFRFHNSCKHIDQTQAHLSPI